MAILQRESIQVSPTPSLLVRYGVAVGVAVLATLLTLRLWSLTAQVPFLLFFAAVMISAWYGGLGPGLLTTALAVMSSEYFLLPPFYSFAIDSSDDLIRLGMFVGVSVMISYLNDQRKRAAEILCKSEEAERAQREYFQVTLASVGDAVIVTDSAGAVTFLNRVAEDITGWTTADATGKPLPEVFHIVNEETRQPVESPVAKVLRTDTVVGLANHTVLIRRDGRDCPIDDSAAPIRDAHGQIFGVILVFRDVTERRQAEEVMRRWQYIFDHAGWAVITIDPQTNTIQMANPAFARMHGAIVEDLIGRPLADTLAPEARATLPAHIAAAHEQGECVYEAQHVRTDGSTFPVLTHVSTLKDKTGRVHLRAATFQDITARKRAEEATLRLAAIVNSSEDAIISKSLDGVVTSWNASAERLFGYGAEEMIGHSIRQLLPADRQEEEDLILARLRGGDPVEHFETVRRTKDGRLIDVSVSISPLRDAHGTIIGASKIARDITARKSAEAERERLLAEVQRINAEFQQFGYIVSHDLNEPLRTMRNYVQLLAREAKGKLDGDAGEYMAFVTDAAQRMQQMLADLLAYTRAGQTPEFHTVDCEAVLTQVLSVLQTQVIEREAVITHDPLPTVQGDATRIGQVLQNLISNALKFCGEKPPRIHISAVREDCRWRFTVRDNGIGIDTQQVGKLFQVFQRAHGKEYAGSGIGLAICKRIVEQHGGRIWVESQPREGSLFHFTISDKSREGKEIRVLMQS